MKKLPPTWLRPEGYEFKPQSAVIPNLTENQNTDYKKKQISGQLELLKNDNLLSGNDIDNLTPKKTQSQERTATAVHAVPVTQVLSTHFMHRNIVQIPLIFVFWIIASARGLV